MIKSRLFFALLFSSIWLASTSMVSATTDGEKSDIAPPSNALQLHGEYLLEYLWVDVYRARLYLPQGFQGDVLSPAVSKSLQLTYLYPLKREELIEAAWITLERQHSPSLLASLRDEIDQLHQRFSAIKPDDRYQLSYDSQQQSLTLLFNDEAVFRSQNPALAQVYLGIWLGENGLSEKLRSALLKQ